MSEDNSARISVLETQFRFLEEEVAEIKTTNSSLLSVLQSIEKDISTIMVTAKVTGYIFSGLAVVFAALYAVHWLVIPGGV